MNFKNLILFLIISSTALGQTMPKDSLTTTAFKLKPYIIPTALVGYGFIALKNSGLQRFNQTIKDKVYVSENKKRTIDNFLQYTPALTVYGLNSVGIQGKNSFKNRTLIYGISYLIMGSTTFGIKTLTKVQRPDGRAFNSFTSGHTATAFSGAEFLWQEYKDKSVWYGISGYLVASATGFFRLYNNRHWFNDVVAGAGIGIASSKIAYWLYPKIQKRFLKTFKNDTTTIIPFYNGNQMGVGMIFNSKN
jgi:membrane-associated phospholipid phosphatase